MLVLEAFEPELHPNAKAPTMATNIIRFKPNASIFSPPLFPSANLRELCLP